MNADEQQDILEEIAFLEAAYPEPEWTDEEIEEFEACTRKEAVYGRPGRETE